MMWRASHNHFNMLGRYHRLARKCFHGQNGDCWPEHDAATRCNRKLIRFAPQWSCRARSGIKLPILSEKDVVNASTRIGKNLARYSIVRPSLPSVKRWNGRFRFDKTNAIASNRSVPPVTPIRELVRATALFAQATRSSASPASFAAARFVRCLQTG
jgi:hypothetical protein